MSDGYTLPENKPLDRLNASRASRGLAALDAREANLRNEYLRDLETAATPEERDRLRKLIAVMDRPSIADAVPNPRRPSPPPAAPISDRKMDAAGDFGDPF